MEVLLVMEALLGMEALLAMAGLVAMEPLLLEAMVAVLLEGILQVVTAAAMLVGVAAAGPLTVGSEFSAYIMACIWLPREELLGHIATGRAKVAGLTLELNITMMVVLPSLHIMVGM